MQGCANITVMPEVLLKRLDYVVGVHKFTGPYSYPYEQGILEGIMGDMIVLISLLVHKNYLTKLGIWNFVKINDKIYENPSFKCRTDELSEKDKLILI